MKDFLNIDYQIDLNTKVLEDLINGYNKTQNKISVLVLFYSLISIYIVPICIALFDFQCTFYYYLYLAVFIFFFVLLIRSLYYTYRLLKPDYISFSEDPSKFYRDLLNQYKLTLETENPEILNEYIKTSYLQNLEIGIERNNKLFMDKGRFYYRSFQSIIFSIICYAFCVGYVQFADINKNQINMSKNNQNQEKPKVVVDPAKVIKVEPKQVRENFNETEKRIIKK